MHKVISFVSFFLMLFSTFNLSGADSNWRDIVEALGDKYGQMMLNGDWEELVECYDKDIVLMRPMSPPIVGLNAMKKELKELKRQGLKYQSISGDIKEGWQCDNMIYERGTLAFSYSTKNQPKPEAYYGSYFTVWKKQRDGSYKIKYSIWNFDFNPWQH